MSSVSHNKKTHRRRFSFSARLTSGRRRPPASTPFPGALASRLTIPASTHAQGPRRTCGQSFLRFSTLSSMNAVAQPYASASGPPPDPAAPHITPLTLSRPSEADLRATEELEQVQAQDLEQELLQEQELHQ